MKGLIGLVVLGAIVFGAFHNSSGSGTSGQSGNSGGYVDSSLSTSSTCDDWNMASRSDQVALAQSIIVTLNAYDTSHRYAVSFAHDITIACEPVGSVTVAQVSAAIATMATADFPPQ